MEAGEVAILFIRDEDDGTFPALRPKDFDDFPVVLRSVAVRSDGVDSVAEEDDGVGVGGEVRQGLGGGCAHPVGHGVGLSGERGGGAAQGQERDSYGKAEGAIPK